MAQGVDRWVAKVLALPVFSHDFADALAASPLANLALIASMEVAAGAQFVQKVSDWAGTMDPKVAEALLREPAMLEQFWSIASSVEKSFFESTALQLGFGLCEPSQAHRVLSEESALRKQAAIRALVSKPARDPKRMKTAKDAPAGSTPLLDHEQAERHKWGAKLEEIGRRAGSWAKLFEKRQDGEELSAGESARLRHLVLTSGAHRTMAAHVRAWERFELWIVANHLTMFPLSLDKVLKYALYLDSRECGPTVIPTLRSSIRWVASRLAIDCPNLDDPLLVALQKEVVNKRATLLKEAVPIPMEVIRCMEIFVVSEAPAAARLFVWWWLCLVFASLRFDDGVHVKPSELQLLNDGLFGVSWQTKVERKRRGTKFVVPRVGFSDVGWLEEGWALLTSDSLDRDFWICDLNSRSEFRPQPPDYHRSVQWLKVLARDALDRYAKGPPEAAKAHAMQVNKLSAHSARVTLLDAAVHAGRSAEEIGLQANWKDPGPLILKYTRNRSSVPAKMVQQLVQDMLAQEHPVQESDDVMLDAPDIFNIDTPEFFLKNPAPGSYYDYRYHCSNSDDPARVACNKFALDECSSMGTVLPDLSVLCKACARARPDVVQAFSDS